MSDGKKEIRVRVVEADYNRLVAIVEHYRISQADAIRMLIADRYREINKLHHNKD